MSNKPKIAIFGGTFNPFHNGHLAIVKSIIESKLVDELWLLVTPLNPWKMTHNLLSNEIRLKMVTDAVSDIPRVKVSDYELKLPIPSYTSDTLKNIVADYPLYDFVLVIGADNWMDFDKWHNYKYIMENHDIIVYPRANCTIPNAVKGIKILDCPLVDISSTEIVRMIEEGESIENLVPPSVAETIREEGLFR